jgi:uncharacterized protein YbjT (DUF2867 family)
LFTLGAEVVKGDLFDFESARAALDGVNAVYFAPHQAGHPPDTAYFAQAAKEVGLTAIV